MRLGWFLLWFTGQILRSNVRLIRDILSPVDRSVPLVLRMQTTCRTDAEVALLSIAISITPGTLVIATGREPGSPGVQLYVHAVYLRREAALAELHALEDHVLRAMRPSGRAS